VLLLRRSDAQAAQNMRWQAGGNGVLSATNSKINGCQSESRLFGPLASCKAVFFVGRVGSAIC